jgi:hypothetical protein
MQIGSFTRIEHLLSLKDIRMLLVMPLSAMGNCQKSQVCGDGRLLFE